MTPTERELLQGMCNCYAVCGEDFENTVRMVANARRLTSESVKAMLNRISKQYEDDPEYRELRQRLPSTFPI